jgi:hypothetical protein
MKRPDWFGAFFFAFGITRLTYFLWGLASDDIGTANIQHRLTHRYRWQASPQDETYGGR